MDLKVVWSVLCVGGVSNGLFCICCMCPKDKKRMERFGNTRCEKCKTKNCRCFCWEVTDGAHIDGLQELICQYVDESCDNGIQRAADLLSKTTIEVDPAIANKTNKPTHIEFDFEESDKETRIQFRKLVLSHLKLRMGLEDFKRIARRGLKAQVEKLAHYIEIEVKLVDAKSTIDRRAKVKYMMQENTVPCTLHMLMRVVGKLRDQLFNQVLDRYQSGKADQKTRQKAVEATEEYMNKVVLGAEEYGIITSWKFPLDKDGMIKQSGITGKMAKKILKAFSGLVSILFSAQYDQSAPNARAKQATRKENERLHGKWQVLLENLIKVFDLVHKKYPKNKMPDEQLDELHVAGCTFMGEYTDMFIQVTNYIHIIGAGHEVYFIREHGNIARLSQQGWEALMQLCKSFYHHKTNRGGAQGNKGLLLEESMYFHWPGGAREGSCGSLVWLTSSLRTWSIAGLLDRRNPMLMWWPRRMKSLLLSIEEERNNPFFL